MRAPAGSFLAALLSELRRECEHSREAWLFGVLRILSTGLSFPGPNCWLARVDGMLERLRTESPPLLIKIFAEQSAVVSLREARARLAARPCGPYQKLRFVQAWVAQAPPRFRMRSLPFSRQTFRVIARLVLGELPVNRIKGMHQFRTNLGDFGSTFFGKRACLHCFLNGDTIVLDSEWHWIFDCQHFSELRMKFPSFHKTLRSIQNNSSRDYVDESDLARLLNMIISDSQLGFSLASFVRQATSLRESWLGDVCVRGRRCTPAKFWHRNLFEHPPCAAEFPPDFQQSFTDGKPWFFGQQAFGP